MATVAFRADLYQEKALLAGVDSAEDHIDPERLAEQMVAGNSDLLVIDIRPIDEYTQFHLRGAVNIPLSSLLDAFASKSGADFRRRSMIVLYSNGMTHPAQARDSLYRLGYRNVYILTDGLHGFIERCLKPASLRSEPLAPETITKIQQWRKFFLAKIK